ncbi:acyl carrier protein [Dactylosporangium cerinum]|uniref:Acyl carrier protein n=1 Tax=Dactylosporangium cerinum TaxID=1434730 RepID=A0ABV9W223_9ACTN
MSAAVDPVVGGVHAEAMDCIQVNLAVLADLTHGRGAHLRLGAPLRLRWRTGSSGLPSVEPSLDEHLEDARLLLGLRPSRRFTGVPGSDVPDVLRPDGHTYLVADAFALPWTPYRGRRHMSHSFLVAPTGGGHDGYEVIDAYHNDTQWGRARPGSHRISAADLVAALASGAQQVLWIDAGPLPAAVPPGGSVDGAAVEEYLRPYRAAAGELEAVDELTLQTWLLARSRRLHSAYLAAAGATGTEAVAGHLDGWSAIVEQTYLALRRVQRGQPAPADLVERLARQLHADLDVFTQQPVPVPVPAPQQSPVGRQPAGSRVADPNWPAFAALVGGVLGVSPDHLEHITSLETVPTWSSLRLVEIVEGLERRFGVRFSGDDLLPEHVRDVDHLLALLGPAGASVLEPEELIR